MKKSEFIFRAKLVKNFKTTKHSGLPMTRGDHKKHQAMQRNSICKTKSSVKQD